MRTRDCDVGATQASRGRADACDFALVVGVDDYPRFRSLRGARRDAERFYEWVTAAGGGAVNAEHARLIRSQPEPAAPLQHQIDDALLELMEAADRQRGGRRLYFYFSGHGASSPAQGGQD